MDKRIYTYLHKNRPKDCQLENLALCNYSYDLCRKDKENCR